ncbi:TPA: DUF1642 domain-containing protein [Streptococcus suis]|nr:DUF1642 domain-containing protein [Streptococcus suis]HEM5068703.1 DUF1642 domain-containing protein [Streptococcus suis]
MNIQEAINELMSKSREIIFGDDENVYLSRKRTIELISQIDQPQKAVVPKFVAKWLEDMKNAKIEFFEAQSNCMSDEVDDWYYNHADDLLRAWLDGYQVEKEQLYTVEIPDPHSSWKYRYLTKNSRGISIIASDNDKWKTDDRNRLTESEIKQDFERAWNAGFAKEVE